MSGAHPDIINVCVSKLTSHPATSERPRDRTGGGQGKGSWWGVPSRRVSTVSRVLVIQYGSDTAGRIKPGVLAVFVSRQLAHISLCLEVIAGSCTLICPFDNLRGNTDTWPVVEAAQVETSYIGPGWRGARLGRCRSLVQVPSNGRPRQDEGMYCAGTRLQSTSTFFPLHTFHPSPISRRAHGLEGSAHLHLFCVVCLCR